MSTCWGDYHTGDTIFTQTATGNLESLYVFMFQGSSFTAEPAGKQPAATITSSEPTVMAVQFDRYGKGMEAHFNFSSGGKEIKRTDAPVLLVALPASTIASILRQPESLEERTFLFGAAFEHMLSICLLKLPFLQQHIGKGLLLTVDTLQMLCILLHTLPCTLLQLHTMYSIAYYVS